MSRSIRVLGPAVLLAVALVATFAGLAYGGGAAPLPIQDPGPVARFGLPISKLFVNLGAAGMLGALVLAVWALTPKRREFDVALDVAAASAALLTVASAATGIFTFLVVTGEPLAFDDASQDEDHDAIAEVAMGSAALGDWTPRFVDYFYTSLSNTMAFSASDALPLSQRMKLLMGLQAFGGFVILALVIARSVGILD